MNSQNVKGIKVKYENHTKVYEVSFFKREDTDVLNDHVDYFIEHLDRYNYNYTLLFEKDLQQL